jgi:hypothetical protein
MPPQGPKVQGSIDHLGKAWRGFGDYDAGMAGFCSRDTRLLLGAQATRACAGAELAGLIDIGDEPRPFRLPSQCQHLPASNGLCDCTVRPA